MTSKDSSMKRTKKDHLDSIKYLENENFKSFQSFTSSNNRKKKKGKIDFQRRITYNSVRDKMRVVTSKEISHKKQNTTTNSSIFKFLTSPRSTKHNNKILSSRMEVRLVQ